MAKKRATKKTAQNKSTAGSSKKAGGRAAKKTERIRYAVIGLGHIAQGAVLPAFAHARENSELIALVSDDAEKLAKLSKRYKVERTFSYEEYEECLESGLVDAVYICLPNHLHRDFTERAAKKGIHVLCEKPLAVTSEDARSMLTACEQAKVKLMTAYRLHFEKANLEAIRIAQSGEIGDLRAFSSTFAFRVTEDNIRLNDESLGGGPLHDIGIYCINASRYLFREVPFEVFACAVKSKEPRFKKIDDTIVATLRYPGDKLATFTVSYSSAPVAYYELLGTKGVLCLDQAYEYYGDMQLELVMTDGKTKTRSFKKSDQFGPEILYFSDCILKDRAPEPDGLEGLIDVQIIEALLRSIREGQPVKLDLEKKEREPDMSQEIRRRPVREPPIIRAQRPSTD